MFLTPMILLMILILIGTFCFRNSIIVFFESFLLENPSLIIILIIFLIFSFIYISIFDIKNKKEEKKIKEEDKKIKKEFKERYNLNFSPKNLSIKKNEKKVEKNIYQENKTLGGYRYILIDEFEIHLYRDKQEVLELVEKFKENGINIEKK